MADRPDKPALKPITPERFVREMRKLAADRNGGTIKAEVYDQRLARALGELRDRGLAGDRAQILAALTPLRDDGTLSAGDWGHLIGRLGLDS